MSDENRIKELEKEVADLKAYILAIKPTGLSPNRVLMQTRRECRERYFGTWAEMREGEITYGPNGKTYSDYSAIEEIVNKTTGLLFKYSYGKPNGGVQIQNLVKTHDDIERYKAICEETCKYLKKKLEEVKENGEVAAEKV